MSDAWILFTLIAVLIQNGRTILQRNMVGRMSITASTAARFCFGLPFTIAYMLTFAAVMGLPLPQPNAQFFIYALIGAVMQISGNALFIAMIGITNFTIGTSYIKTEVVIAAVLTFLLLGDTISLAGFAGIMLTLFGIMVTVVGRTHIGAASFLLALRDRSALLGLAVAGCYALGSTSYRAGALSLGLESNVLAALYMLAWVCLLQAAVMTAWMAAKRPAAFGEMIRHKVISLGIGIFGVTSSAFWFIAFSLQNTAYVLAVGQCELIVAYLASRFLYKERASVLEYAGIAVTVAGILCVVLGR